MRPDRAGILKPAFPVAGDCSRILQIDRQPKVARLRVERAQIGRQRQHGRGAQAFALVVGTNDDIAQAEIAGIGETVGLRIGAIDP